VRPKNPVEAAPMHKYSGVDGFPVEWHLMKAGRFAAGGSGPVIVE
jgi:2,4-dienoyl-CoA reductase-like NADH-dependent reductase (Old Yellow Enzyme family)